MTHRSWVPLEGPLGKRRATRLAPLIAALVLLASPLSVQAETLPPGKYHCTGLVVEKADGEIAVFHGSGCYRFPKKLHAKLRPYLGKFVKVEYVRISDKEGGMTTMVGSVIGRIEKVTVLAKNYDTLPLVIEVTPSKKAFAFREPIRLTVVITNPGRKATHLVLFTGHTSLCQDYEGVTSLEPEGHYYSERPYGLSRMPKLGPDKKVQFTITSQRMVQPGTYQLVYSLPGDPRLDIQSRIHEITVAAPAGKRGRMEALKFWLARATPGQRVEIAERLLKHGDASGTEEILRLLQAGEYSKEHYLLGRAFHFAWRHGGEKGETVMMKLIAGQTKQDCVVRMIEGIHLSKNRLKLLEKLLADKHPTHRDISGWCARPRICDITASWLAGYTQGKMKFPQKGPVKEKDAAVARVLKKLKENSSYFRVLSDSYK